MQILADRAAEVRNRVPISSVIAKDVKLRRVGREYTGLCPFHSEKNDGAFMVNDDKQIYWCFSGCADGGDVIKYLQKRKGLTFIEALKELESSAGIDFTNAKPKATGAARERADKGDAKSEETRANAFQLWLGSPEGKDGPAHSYLRGRIPRFDELGHFPRAIRFRMDLPNAERKMPMPAMLTAIVGLNGKFRAVHRTYLERLSDGRWVKARNLEKPKMVLGSFRGGFIALWKGMHRQSLGDLPAGAMVALSEGIEDGLSMAVDEPSCRYLAAISLDNMGNVALPPQAGDLILLCQRDQEDRLRRAAAAHAAGDMAAAAHHQKCAVDIERALERAIAKQQRVAAKDGSHRAVRCAWPDQGFKDFNDQARGVRMEGAA